MEIYSVTVNGVTYDVKVEKKSSVNAATPSSGPAHVNTIAPAPTPVVAAPVMEGIKITAGAAGKVWKVVAKEGQAVKLGAPIIILEAMKMEIPVVAPKDGIVTQIIASEGSPVEAGDVLATMN